MNEKILLELDKIEREHKVRVLYACESGSRAWGFPSLDSDYDVRFIYCHPMEWYLSVDEKRDVIELPIDDSLDINGWDLRKTLKLMRKSNSPLFEWLSSPIVYKAADDVLRPIVELSKKAFLPETSCHHYLSMARNIMADIQAHEEVKKKKYLYALRPVLCTKWIIKYKTQPPMLMEELLLEFLSEGSLRQYIDDLIQTKRSETESVKTARFHDLDCYLESQIADLKELIPKNPASPIIEEFNGVFKKVLL